MRNLVIGGIEIPVKSTHTLSQNYEPAQAVNRVRMGDGTLVQQTSWNDKLITTIDGSGLIPPGIQSLDYSATVIIKCAAERAVSSSSNVIGLPSARRGDYAPVGRALVDGMWQTTPCAMSVDEATLTVVAGATLYQAIYWPELICYCDPPSETRGVRNSSYGWSLVGEQL